MSCDAVFDGACVLLDVVNVLWVCIAAAFESLKMAEVFLFFSSFI